MWSYWVKTARYCDEARGEGVWTPAYYREWIARERAVSTEPIAFLIGMHPDDRAAYAPLIAAVEDDAREHGDVMVDVIVSEQTARL